MTKIKTDLTNVSTKDLSEELVKRTGVRTRVVDIDSKVILFEGAQHEKILGPAIIIINQDQGHRKMHLKRIEMISGGVYENVELVIDVPEEIKSISEDMIGIRQGTDLIWINKTATDSLQTEERNMVEVIRTELERCFEKLFSKYDKALSD